MVGDAHCHGAGGLGHHIRCHNNPSARRKPRLVERFESPARWNYWFAVLSATASRRMDLEVLHHGIAQHGGLLSTPLRLCVPLARWHRISPLGLSATLCGDPGLGILTGVTETLAHYVGNSRSRRDCVDGS